MNSTGISRRTVLTAAGASGVLALAGCVGNGDDDTSGGNGVTEGSDDVLRVGVLGALTGPNGPEFGHQGLTGFLSGLAYKDSPDSIPETNPALDTGDVAVDIEQIHGEIMEVQVGDIDFELHIRDSEDSSGTAAINATRLARDDDVDVIFGLSNSSSLVRVSREVIPYHDIPLFGGQASTSAVTADAETCDRRLFRATETSAMSARAGVQFIAQNPAFERAALFGSDFSFGRSMIETYSSALENAGVEVVDQQIRDRGHAEWRGHLQQAVEDGADVVAYGFTAQTGIPFFLDFTQDGDGNLNPIPMQIIGDLPDRSALSDMGNSFGGLVAELDGIDLNAALRLIGYGPLTARYMWNQYDNDINDAFIRGQRQAYGVNPDLFSSSAFASASAIVQALDEEGEISSEAIIEGVHGMTVEDTPKGRGEYVFQEYNNQARSPMTVVDIVESPIEGDLAEEDQYWPPLLKPTGVNEADRPGGVTEPFTVDKDELTLQADEIQCDLR